MSMNNDKVNKTTIQYQKMFKAYRHMKTVELEGMLYEELQDRRNYIKKVMRLYILSMNNRKLSINQLMSRKKM